MHNARRYGGAFGLSLVWHGLLVCVAILLIGTASEPASRVPVPQTTFKYVHVMTPAPGPTGGGGGSRAPLPPRPEMIVRPAAAPQPVPIAAVPIAIETPPRPTLDVSISATTPIVQGVGTSLTSIADLGGNGRGARGLGDGDVRPSCQRGTRHARPQPSVRHGLAVVSKSSGRETSRL